MQENLLEQRIDREVIYVYETPDFSEQRVEELGLREKMKEFMEYRKSHIQKIKCQMQKRGVFLNFFAESLKDAMSFSSDPLRDRASSVRMELHNKIRDFKQIRWLPEKYQNLTANDAEERFFDCFSMTQFSTQSAMLSATLSAIRSATLIGIGTEGVSDRMDKEESKFNEYYQAWAESYPPLFAAAVRKANEETKTAHFLSVAEIENLYETDKIQILNTKKFSSGQIFIKHPFMPHTYMNIETSESELFHIKMQCLSRIMQCLGATRVSGHAYVSDSKQRQMDANGKISYKVVDADGSFSKAQSEKYESDYILEDAFSGDFSEKSYEDAISEAKRVGLYEDFDIKNLLDQRNPEKQNKMIGRTVKIEMTRELNESLDIAFSLQAAGFGMNGAYKEILETQRKIMFELEIEF